MIPNLLLPVFCKKKKKKRKGGVISPRIKLQEGTSERVGSHGENEKA